MTSLPLDRMERFQDIFDALRGGRHLSADTDDAALWRAWRPHKEAWPALLRDEMEGLPHRRIAASPSKMPGAA